MPCVIICTLCDLVRQLEDGRRSGQNMSVNCNVWRNTFCLCAFCGSLHCI